MNKITLIASLFAVILIPSFAHAGPIIRSGETISVDASQVLKGDFYGLASTVNISGPAENDLYVGGGTVTVNAPVKGDLTVIGGVVQVHGDVGDDLRIVGGEVVLAKSVEGDVVVAGGTLTILSTAVVHGDVLFMGGDLTIEGTIMGTIHGTSDTLRIDSEVGGDVSYVATNAVTFGDKAHVVGRVTYESPRDLVRAQNAQIDGDITKKDVPSVQGSSFVNLYLIQISVLLFVAFSFFLVGRRYLQNVIEKSASSVGLSGLIGLGVFLVIPFISGVLLVSVVGLLLGIILFALYVLALIVSFVCAGVLFGYGVQRAVMQKSTVTFSTILFGVIIFNLFSFVPYLGGLLIFAGMLVMLGGMSTAVYHKLRS